MVKKHRREEKGGNKLVKKIYLDSGIFIAYKNYNDSEDKHLKVKKFLEYGNKNVNVEFYASSWTLTEAIKVLITNKNIEPQKVIEFSEKILRTRRLGKMKFHWLPISEIKGYDLDEFFYDIQVRLLKKRIGVGDTMHIVLMKRSEIDTIITFDVDDFSKFENITVIKPENFYRYKF